MTRDTDILIVGGGLNGPVLALAAAKAGIRSIVIDPQPGRVRKEKEFDGRSYAVAAASSMLLADIGIWDQIVDTAQPMLEIKVTDGRAGEGPSPFWLHFDHAELEGGPMGYMVEDRYLRRALLDAIDAHPLIETREDAVVSQETKGTDVSVALASGDRLKGLVLVGCDGRTSGTAERAGIKRTGWAYAQTALVCAIAHEKPHHGIAHQFFMPPGPLAILPLTDNRSSIVWSESAQQAAAINALSEADYLQVLRPRFGDFLGEISLAGARYTYPLGLSLAQSLVADRVALVGDSAHGVHPIAGQGLNAGIRDVRALARVLTRAKQRGEDIGSECVLERYAQARKGNIAALAMATDGFNRLFSNDNPLLRIGRDMGMGMVNAVPSLRRAFMREAAGLKDVRR